MTKRILIYALALSGLHSPVLSQAVRPPREALHQVLTHFRGELPQGAVALEKEYFRDASEAGAIAKLVGLVARERTTVRGCDLNSVRCTLADGLVGALTINHSRVVQNGVVVIDLDVRERTDTAEGIGIHLINYQVTVTNTGGNAWRITAVRKVWES